MQIINDTRSKYNNKISFMLYDNFYEIKEIGSGGYGTVYIAKYKLKIFDKYTLEMKIEQVVLKEFKNNDWKTELFISEVSIHV